MGKSRSYITNSLRLLNLPEDVLDLIASEKISSGHAKILVGLDNASFVANKVLDKKLSVRQTERLVKIFKKNKNIFKRNRDTNINELETTLSQKIGLNVLIQNKKNNKGKITFEYKDLDQLNKVIDVIKNNY